MPFLLSIESQLEQLERTSTVADLYRVILDAALAGQQIGHGREGFYFGENGEHTLYQIAEAIGCALQELRLADTATPSTFTKHELDKYFAGVRLFTSSL